MSDEDEELHTRIEKAISYPLRHSEVEDFRWETLIDNIVELIENEKALAAPTEPEPALEYGPNTPHILALIAKFDACTQSQKNVLYEAYRAGHEPFWVAQHNVVGGGRAERAGLWAALDALSDRLYVWGGVVAAYGAALALLIRDLPEFTQAEYYALSHPWRTVMGPIHPDDAEVLL